MAKPTKVPETPIELYNKLVEIVGGIEKRHIGAWGEYSRIGRDYLKIHRLRDPIQGPHTTDMENLDRNIVIGALHGSLGKRAHILGTMLVMEPHKETMLANSDIVKHFMTEILDIKGNIYYDISVKPERDKFIVILANLYAHLELIIYWLLPEYSVPPLFADRTQK